MIDFYFAPTPNGWKVAILLFELGEPFETHFVDLPSGEQLRPEFRRINPNGKIPAIVDRSSGQDGLPVFESGAILLYLSDKFGRFGAPRPELRKDLHEWLFWQAGNQGPMAGQLSHFVNYAGSEQPYARERYLRETERTFGVLEERLRDREYILEDYSIADMMIFPWAFIGKKLGIDLDRFPRVSNWRSHIKERPAVRAAIDLHKERQFTGKTSAAKNSILFNQGASSLGGGADA